MKICRQPHQLPRLRLTATQKSHVPRTRWETGRVAEQRLTGIIVRQKVHIQLAYHDHPSQIQAGQDIRMNLAQKTDLSVPAENAAGFPRMQKRLPDVGPK